MPRARWKLTIDDARPEIDEWGSEDARRLSGAKIPLLARLAADPRNGLVEIAPGVFEGPKCP